MRKIMARRFGNETPKYWRGVSGMKRQNNGEAFPEYLSKLRDSPQFPQFPKFCSKFMARRFGNDKFSSKGRFLQTKIRGRFLQN